MNQGWEDSGDAIVDLLFERGRDNACKVQVLKVDGILDVVIEPSKSSPGKEKNSAAR